MKTEDLDKYGIPIAHSNSTGKIVACDIQDIVYCVGLVQYSRNSHKHKVIWPYALYYKKIDGRKHGQLRYL